MSFDIPIFFEDSPFFKSGSFFQRQPRNTRFSREGRRPDVFQTRTRPRIRFDDRDEDCFYGPVYRSRQGDFVKRPQRNERSGEGQLEGRLEGNEEDIYNQEYLTGSALNPDMNNYGWNIPVQFVKAPVAMTRQQKHKHAHEPHQHTRKNKAKGKSDEGEAQQPRLPTPAQTREVRNETANKIQEEPAKIKPDEQDQDKPTKALDEEVSKKREPTREIKTNKLPCNDEKPVDLNQDSKENDRVIDIPVLHSTEQEQTRQQSKRLSQCEPPSPTDIKLTRIKSIIDKSQVLEDKIKEFSDPVQNQKYLYISETLTSLLLDLDAVDSDGIDIVRKARREGVLTIQNLVTQLDNKLAENKKKGEPEYNDK